MASELTVSVVEAPPLADTGSETVDTRTTGERGSMAFDTTSPKVGQQPSIQPAHRRLSWLERLMRPAAAIGVFRENDQATIIKLVRSGEAVIISDAAAVQIDQVQSILKKRLASHGASRHVVFAECTDDVVYRMNEYPPMSRAELSRVLSREAAGLCPNHEQVYWDYAVAGKGADGAQQQVLLAAIPTELADRLVAGLGLRNRFWSNIGSHRLAHLAVLQRQITDDSVTALVDIHSDYLTVDICNRGQHTSPWPKVVVSRKVPLPPNASASEVAPRVAAEVQRSMVYHRQLTHGTRVNRVVLSGNHQWLDVVRLDLAALLPVPVAMIDMHDVAEIAPAAAEALKAPGSWDAAIGLALQAIAGSKHSINLLPNSMRNAASQRLRKGIVAAAVLLAALIISGSVKAINYASDTYQQVADNLGSQARMAAPLLAARAANQTQKAALAEHLTLIAALSGRRLPWAALMMQISSAVGSDIRMASIGVTPGETHGDWQLMLSGTIPASRRTGAGRGTPEILERVLGRLRGATFIESAQLLPIAADASPPRGGGSTGAGTSCQIRCKLNMAAMRGATQ